MCFFFFFKQKTAYEMRISDWSSDVCSSDLNAPSTPTCSHVGGSPSVPSGKRSVRRTGGAPSGGRDQNTVTCPCHSWTAPHTSGPPSASVASATARRVANVSLPSTTTSAPPSSERALRSEEHKYELTSLMSTPYAN